MTVASEGGRDDVEQSVFNVVVRIYERKIKSGFGEVRLDLRYCQGVVSDHHFLGCLSHPIGLLPPHPLSLPFLVCVFGFSSRYVLRTP